MNRDDERSGQTRSGIPVSPAGERTLQIEQTPARNEQQEIHPRRPLPAVPSSSSDDDTPESNRDDE